MRLTSPTTHRLGRLLGVTALGVGALGIAATATAGAAEGRAGLDIVVTGHGPAFAPTLDITCESPTPPPTPDGVELGSARTEAREHLLVPADGTTIRSVAGLTAGTACAVTASGPTAAALGAVDGGTPLVGSDGRLRGVAVTVDRGTTATASLTFTIPVGVASTVPRTESTETTATGSGSAASTPPALPGGDGPASAAAPVALAAARSTTTASSAALPDTSGSGTTLVLSSIGVLLCGAGAYALVLRDRRQERAHR
ncbi:MAG: hypothetical protein ACXVJ7_13920 [Acidimicrobiia bacterium]